MASSFGRNRLPSQLPGTPGSRARSAPRRPVVSTTAIADRFPALPDAPALQTTVVALEEHGFSVEVVGDLDAARQAVLARIPEGSSVMTNASGAWHADPVHRRRRPPRRLRPADPAGRARN